MNSNKFQMKRVLKLTDQAAQQRASEILRAVAGVCNIETLEEQQLRITYDCTRLSWAVVCDTLAEAGVCACKSVFARWRDGWREFLDRNMRENLSHKVACCSKAPPDAVRR